MTEHEIKRALVVNLTCFYRPPNHLEAEGQAKAYLDELVDTFIRMRPTPEEWEYVWNEFKREWVKTYWPLPSEFPQRLMKFRAKQASGRKAAGLQEHEPAPRRALEHRPYSHREFMASVAMANEMARSSDPGQAALGRVLVKCANALLKNRDDQDRPRFPQAEAAE